MHKLNDNEVKAVLRMTDALNVMVHTPHIREYLKANDPKALEQAEKALDAWSKS
jgi:hypothetical protein